MKGKCMMMNDKTKITKPHVNIGTIGQGKTRLCAEITKLLSLKGDEATISFQEDDLAKKYNEDNPPGITINPNPKRNKHKKKKKK